MNGHGQSDRFVVPANPPNKAARAAAEAGEERERAKGNTGSETRPGRSAGPGVSSGLDRVREVARRDKDARFTALLHHVSLHRLGLAAGDVIPDDGADYLGTVVWDHITGLLADPALIRAEIGKRLTQARTADPAARQRERLELALAKATTAITRMIEAFQEQLITIDELRARMPALRARETNLRGQADALDAQLADREAYLKLADDLEGFLAQLRASAATGTVGERQRVLRLLVKDILIGPEKITIRHRIPTRERSSPGTHQASQPDTEGDHRPGYPLRWGRGFAVAR